VRNACMPTGQEETTSEAIGAHVDFGSRRVGSECPPFFVVLPYPFSPGWARGASTGFCIKKERYLLLSQEQEAMGLTPQSEAPLLQSIPSVSELRLTAAAIRTILGDIYLDVTS